MQGENENIEPEPVLQEIQAGYMLKDRLLDKSFLLCLKNSKDKNDEKNSILSCRKKNNTHISNNKRKKQ